MSGLGNGAEERSDLDRFTTRELVEEAHREARMRRRVYARAVGEGRMSRQEADRKIDLMMAIAGRLVRTGGV